MGGIKEKVVQVLSLNVVLWMTMLVVFTGVLFCAAGVYLALAGPLGPMSAAFITGGGLIGLVVVLLLLAVLVSASGKRRAKTPAPHGADNMIEQQIRPVIGDQATNWAKQNTGLAVAGALSAGVIIAASPRLRAVLLGAAGPLFTRKLGRTLHDLTGD